MYQKITLVGYLGQDPDMRYLQDATAVTTFSVATNRRFKTKDGEDRDETTWFRVTAWGKLAEITNEYLTKGRQVLVEGTVSVYAYRGRDDGEPRASLQVRADRVLFLGGKGERTAVPAGAKVAAGAAGVEEDEIPF